MRAIKAYTKSSSFIVSFVFMTLLFIGVGFNTYVLTITNDDLLIRETEAAIVADIGGFRSLYASAGRKAVVDAVNQRLNDINNDFFYYLKDGDDNFITGNLDIWPSQNVNLIRNGLLDIEAKLRPKYRTDHQPKRQAAIAMIAEFTNKDALLVARSMQQYEFSVWLAQTSSWVMISIVGIISILSIAVAYYVVSRINKIADTADTIITEGNLSERLYVESEWDDLSKLTLTLNQLLDKVEQSFHGIRSVSDNIAHDLKTPLTRLKTHIEELPEQEQKHQLTAECDNILAIFNSLLRITFIETNAKRAGFEHTDLRVVLDDAVDLYQPMIEEKNIDLHLSLIDEAKAFCDKSLIFQIFTNVIDNAVKFTPENEAIDIVLTKSGDSVMFKVTDSGIGVEDETLDKLTRRFYRAEKSRTTTGNGLGLSLVAAVVSLHKGQLTFTQRRDKSGLVCSILIPGE